MQSNGKKNKENNSKETLNRLAAIGEISAGIAHEVKNPLTAVKGFLELLNQEMPHKYLDIASSEVERAISTLTNLLQVSKPDMDNEDMSQVNICSELESILYLFQDQIYRISFIKKFRNTNELVYGKKNVLKKAFFNIIKNAIEAITDKGTITIEHFRQGNWIHIKITDSGEGIPEEKLALLGTPFFSMKDEGTGLGLAQVYTTIYQHGGKIDVVSQLGRGTSFHIQIPINNTKDKGVLEMNYTFSNEDSYKDYYDKNKESFDKILLEKAVNVVHEIEEKKSFKGDYLIELSNHKVDYLHTNNEHGLIKLAKENGITWARLEVPMILKLDWIQAFREAYLDLLFQYHVNQNTTLKDFYLIEREKNSLIDTYHYHFVLSFNEYKETLLKSQRELAESLAVPIIPLAKNIAILPIIGMVDTYRAKKIQEKVLQQIKDLSVSQLIIDVSGVAYMDTAVVGHLFKIIGGVRLLGCKATMTGIRPEVANTVIEMGINVTDHVETRRSLAQALEELNSIVIK